MKQRLAIGAALLGNPEVLVLDEPTNGLDPQGIAEIRELIIRIGKSGKTIIIASHILDEIQKVCTHCAILRKGQLLQVSTIDHLIGNQDVRLIKVKAGDMAKVQSLIDAEKNYSVYKEEDGASYMKAQDLRIRVDLGVGHGQATVWTCDLTHGYITINADYRS